MQKFSKLGRKHIRRICWC